MTLNPSLFSGGCNNCDYTSMMSYMRCEVLTALNIFTVLLEVKSNNLTNVLDDQVASIFRVSQRSHTSKDTHLH